MEGKYIPKYLNAEPQILWWDLSDFLVFLFFLSFGIISGFPYIFALIGISMLKLSTKLYGKKEAGYPKHLAYHLGFYGLKNRVPQSWCKELSR